MPSRRAVLATSGSALLAGCGGFRRDPTVTGSWPQIGYDRARAGVPDHDLDGPEPPLTSAWSRSLPPYGGSNTSPILADGTLYVGYTDGPQPGASGERTVTIEAVDPGTGDSQWTATATTTRERRGTRYHADSLALAGDGETVLIQTSNGLCAVDTDGTGTWCFDNVGDGQLSHQTVSPGVDDETVYVGRYRQIATRDIEPVFYAVDLEDGTERWRHEFETWQGRLVYSPAVDDGVVYLTEHAEGVKALDAADGTELWHESIPVDSAPTVANGGVFVTTADDDEHGAVALDTDTGDVRWQVDGDAGGAWAPRHLAATDDAVYYVTDGRLLARDVATGERHWTDVDRQLVADDSTLADEEVVTVEAGTPAVVGDRIYVGAHDLVVVDRETGGVISRYETDRSLTNAVAVADGWLYATSDATLYGLTACDTELFGRCLR